MFENISSQVVEVMICVWVVEAFRKAVDKYAGMRRPHLDLRV
jgi:hypothetical protein